MAGLFRFAHLLGLTQITSRPWTRLPLCGLVFRAGFASKVCEKVQVGERSSYYEYLLLRIAKARAQVAIFAI